jgi:putative ABC transport system ATP-binding protein
MDIFHRLHEEKGITMVMVTHDEDIGAESERIVRLFDGRIAGGVER